MKAVYYEKYGSPKNIKVIETETPHPENNDLLIKIYAAAVNRTDCAYLRAHPFS